MQFAQVHLVCIIMLRNLLTLGLNGCQVQLIVDISGQLSYSVELLDEHKVRRHIDALVSEFKI